MVLATFDDKDILGSFLKQHGIFLGLEPSWAPKLLPWCLLTFALSYLWRKFVHVGSLYECRKKDHLFGLDYLYERLFCDTLPSSYLESSRDKFIQNGATYAATRFNVNYYKTIEPANVKHILSTGFTKFEYPEGRVHAVTKLMGTGIFGTNGEQWSTARTVMIPAFTKQRFDCLPSLLSEHTQKFINKLSYQSATDVSVKLQPLILSLTMDLATDFLFGASAGFLDDSQMERRDQFDNDVKVMSNEISAHMHLGPFSFLRRDKQALEAKSRLSSFVRHYTSATMAELQTSPVSGGSSGHDKSVMREFINTYGESQELYDQILHVLLASRDTTASVLASFFFTIAKFPEIYARLRSQVISAVGQSDPSIQELKNIVYLRWCVNEILRLYPPVSSNARQAVDDTFLPKGGGKNGSEPIVVPKGSFVVFSSYSMHRAQDVYGPDADHFNPDRWETLRPGWAFIPFSGGPRICVGQQFAISEIYYVIARFVQHFSSIEATGIKEWTGLLGFITACGDDVDVILRTD